MKITVWQPKMFKQPHAGVKPPKPRRLQSTAKKLANDIGSTSTRRSYSVATIAPWLDEASVAQVDAIVASLVSRQPNLRAIILFGSIARHDERSLDDDQPSDVDILLLIDLSTNSKRLSLDERLAISHAIVSGMRQQPDGPREINVFTSATDLSEWHEDFVTNLIHDGVALWARSPLPPLLAPVQHRSERFKRTTRRGG